MNGRRETSFDLHARGFIHLDLSQLHDLYTEDHAKNLCYMHWQECESLQADISCVDLGE